MEAGSGTILFFDICEFEIGDELPQALIDEQYQGLSGIFIVSKIETSKTQRKVFRIHFTQWIPKTASGYLSKV